MTDFTSRSFSDCDDEVFVLSVLQRQMRTKLSRLVASSALSKEDIAERSGLGLDKLNSLLDGKEAVSPSDLSRIIDAVDYFNSAR